MPVAVLEGPLSSLGVWNRPSADGTGHVVLRANDNLIGEHRMGVHVPPWWHGGSLLCIGFDEGLPVTHAYEPPLAYTGEHRRVAIKVEPSDEPAGLSTAAALRAD